MDAEVSGKKRMCRFMGNLEEMWPIRRQEQEKNWRSSKTIVVSF